MEGNLRSRCVSYRMSPNQTSSTISFSSYVRLTKLASARILPKRSCLYAQFNFVNIHLITAGGRAGGGSSSGEGLGQDDARPLDPENYAGGGQGHENRAPSSFLLKGGFRRASIGTLYHRSAQFPGEN